MLGLSYLRHSLSLRSKRNPKNVLHLAVAVMNARGDPIKGLKLFYLFYPFVRLIILL